MLEPPGTTPAANSTGGVWTAPPRGGHPTHTGAAAMHDHQGAEKGSGSTTDPVCGMTVDPATTPHTATHSGKHHYFCSAGCLAKFEADPDLYAEKSEPAPADEPDGARSEGPTSESQPLR